MFLFTCRLLHTQTYDISGFHHRIKFSFVTLTTFSIGATVVIYTFAIRVSHQISPTTPSRSPSTQSISPTNHRLDSKNPSLKDDCIAPSYSPTHDHFTKLTDFNPLYTTTHIPPTLPTPLSLLSHPPCYHHQYLSVVFPSLLQPTPISIPLSYLKQSDHHISSAAAFQPLLPCLPCSHFHVVSLMLGVFFWFF